MAEILLRNIHENQRKGFKVACAAVDESMADMLKVLVDCGYDYDENRKLIENYERLDVSGFDKATKADKLESLYSGLLFFELYIWKAAQGSTESVLEYQDALESIAKFKKDIIDQMDS